MVDDFEQSVHWASGSWQVEPGKAEEFIERWKGFLTWTRKANDGCRFAMLLREDGDPDHFVSFASWDGLGSLRGWREQQEFAEHFARCRELCTDMRGGNYETVGAV